MKVQLIKEIQKENKSLKQKIQSLSTDLERAKKKNVSLDSQQITINATKRNLLIHQVLNQKRQKKKKLKTDTSSDAFDEEDTPEMYKLKQKNKYLKHMISTQTNQIGNLYLEVSNLQEKEDDHLERIQAYDKLDRYFKRLTKKNSEVKTEW